MLLAKGLCSPTRSRNPPICSHEETRHVTENEADPKSVLRATLSPIGGFGSLDGMHGGGAREGGDERQVGKGWDLPVGFTAERETCYSRTEGLCRPKRGRQQ